MLIRSLCLALLALLALVARPTQAQVCNGNVTLRSQAEVDAFDCVEVTGSLAIGFYSQAPTDIDNLDGLADLTSVGYNLGIWHNPLLTDLDKLSGLNSLQSLTIVNNDGLVNIGGLSSVTDVREIRISDNASLTNLDGLTNVAGDVYSLVVFHNESLTDIDGLAGITSTALLSIFGNDALRDVDGLLGLTFVGSTMPGPGTYNMYILGNDALLNLDGLANITSVAANIRVRGNQDLASCTVGLGDVLKSGSVTGDIEISDNAPGCNSIWEAMGAGVDTEDDGTPLITGLATAYPNPSSGATMLAFTLAEGSEVRLTVYDTLGRRVKTLAQGQYAAGTYEASFGTALPAGVYIVRFETGGEAWTEHITFVR